MNIIKTQFEGLFLIEHRVLKDERGVFIKTYNKNSFQDNGIDLDIKERYFSVSKKDVIRGMHFQVPPYDHTKIVTVINGRIIDVVLDIRKNSKTYGKYYYLELSAREGKSIYIPPGFAHGFKVLSDSAIVEYNQTTIYKPEYDRGLRFDSFGFDWYTSNPIVSSRDNNFESFESFLTPFV